MKIVTFLGAPGSGKGTQAQILAKSDGYLQLSTGDMLREAVKEGTELGKKAQQFIEKGELVPDDVMIALIESRLSELSGDQKVLLDGFPRTVPQAEALDKNEQVRPDLALSFEIPRDRLVERLTGRRTCPKCASIFHIEFNPPMKSGICDKCGTALTQRKDDVAEVVIHRLEVFEEKYKALLDYYRNQNRLKEIAADDSVENVQAKLTETLNSWFK